jgi:hypothetical protein
MADDKEKARAFDLIALKFGLDPDLADAPRTVFHRVCYEMEANTVRFVFSRAVASAIDAMCTDLNEIKELRLKLKPSTDPERDEKNEATDEVRRVRGSGEDASEG